MSKRRYTHIKELIPAIKATVAERKTQREIAEYYGLKDSEAVHPPFPPLGCGNNGL